MLECKALDNKVKQGEVKKFLHSHNIRLFSFLETMVKAHALGEFYLNVCSRWCLTTNNPLHGKGRIIVGWHPTAMHVDIISCSGQIVRFEIEVVNRGEIFYTFIYGFYTGNEIEALWSDLRRLVVDDKPWIILGDLNAIMQFEKRICQLVRAREVEDM